MPHQQWKKDLEKLMNEPVPDDMQRALTKMLNPMKINEMMFVRSWIDHTIGETVNDMSGHEFETVNKPGVRVRYKLDYNSKECECCK